MTRDEMFSELVSRGLDPNQAETAWALLVQFVAAWIEDYGADDPDGFGDDMARSWREDVGR